jgi:uncharacterized protein (DUF305 family)
MTFKKRRFVAPLVAMMLALLILTACGGNDDEADGAGTMAGHDMNRQSTPAMTPMMGTPMPGVDMALAFIDGMIVHHQSAIDMAEVALDRAEHEEILELAEQIIAAQQSEIDRMREWRSEWFGDVPETGGMPGMEHAAGMDMTSEELERLRDADPFDRAFIDMMIPHHESAVMMAEGLRMMTDRPELLQLIEDIMETQQAEIEQMREWRRDWYGE